MYAGSLPASCGMPRMGMPCRFTAANNHSPTLQRCSHASAAGGSPWSVAFDAVGILHDLEVLIATPHFGRAWLFCETTDADAAPLGYLLLCFDYSLEYGGRGALDRRVLRRPHPPRPGSGRPGAPIRGADCTGCRRYGAPPGSESRQPRDRSFTGGMDSRITNGI